MNEAENRAEDGAKNNTENGAGEDGEGDYDTVLLDGARRLCRTYFKSGDFSYQIVITPGAQEQKPTECRCSKERWNRLHRS